MDQARTITAASLEGRAFFNLHNRPAFLQIDPIRLEDAGDYRCRVGKCAQPVGRLKIRNDLID